MFKAVIRTAIQMGSDMPPLAVGYGPALISAAHAATTSLIARDLSPAALESCVLQGLTIREGARIGLPLFTMPLGQFAGDLPAQREARCIELILALRSLASRWDGCPEDQRPREVRDAFAVLSKEAV
jgi:hypothetical protein